VLIGDGARQTFGNPDPDSFWESQPVHRNRVRRCRPKLRHGTDNTHWRVVRGTGRRALAFGVNVLCKNPGCMTKWSDHSIDGAVTSIEKSRRQLVKN
jgi:hypothetical protein